MTYEMLDALQQWQQDCTGRRAVNIEMGKPSSLNEETIWVYDYNAMYGKHVKTPQDLENLDLYALRKQELQKQLNALSN